MLGIFILMKDNFSNQAADYAKYRPVYPEELFDFILSHVLNKEAAWDCGTGNGQTARILAINFQNVFATDISQNQIENAWNANNILYSVQPAEKTNFPDDLFDLVTVSQALHWFQVNDFYKEVRRVSKAGAWIAVWTYSNLRISPPVDELVNVQHYKNRLGTYWDYERKYVDEQYQTLSFPFKEIKTPSFEIRLQWTLDELKGYLKTWSSLQKFIALNNEDPLPKLIEKISAHWTTEKMPVVFPLHLRMGQIEK
jgi:ubiquinone/menaquinone biosynthesis C-methylase UbiE